MMNDPLSPRQIVAWAFFGVMGGVVIFGVSVMSRISESIATLNVQVAEVVRTISYHEKELDSHEGRIQVLERGKR